MGKLKGKTRKNRIKHNKTYKRCRDRLKHDKRKKNQRKKTQDKKDAEKAIEEGLDGDDSDTS